MIELKNISTLSISGLDGSKRSTDVSRTNAGLIRKYDLDDYAKLKDFYNHTGIYADITDKMDRKDGVGRIIQSMESLLSSPSRAGLEPELFLTDYSSSLLDPVGNLYDIDKSNLSSVLLYGSPFEYGTDMDCFNRIGYKRKKRGLPNNIYILKQLLMHCSSNGVNLLKKQSGLSVNEIEKILKALEIYEEQLKRQYDTSKDISDNSKLFYVDKEEKDALIRSQYDDIADYLSSFDHYIWGEESEKEAQTIWKSAHRNTKNDLCNKRLLINTISNYVSLEEAKDIKTKTLSRFVVK